MRARVRTTRLTMPLRLSCCATGALIAGLLLPASASAAGASATALKGCYVSVAAGRTEPVHIDASGFTPGAPIDIRIDGTTAASARAGADGRLQASVAAPHQARGERRFSVQLRQRDDFSRSVRLRSRVTALEVRLSPRSAPLGATVAWAGRGFTARGPVYAHYVNAGAVQRTIRLARPRGDCGAFRTRRPQFPFRPAVGTWRIQVDQQRPFALEPDSPFVRLPVTVLRASG